jgi:hypothetical protein
MLPFSVSIAILSIVQASLLAAPRPAGLAALARLRNRWWTLVLPASIIVVIGAVALDATTAHALAYLALVAVPPLAALALGALLRGAQPLLALLVVPLFAAAWAFKGSLLGQGAALALSGLACVSLGWLLASVVPPRWLRPGIYAMAAVDTYLVAADLLQGPNAVINAASPGGLPQLQLVSFGSAVMGFGDLFVAATLGALLARDRSLQLAGAALAAILALSFDLLFFVVNELPATVPIALTLAILDRRDCRG